MGIKAFLSKPIASWVVKKQQKWMQNPTETQNSVFSQLISQAQNTVFGQTHGFKDIKNHQDFQKQVPLRDYEALAPYIKQIIEGKNDVLWPGKPIYFAKTSGTTSGSKYIPITKQSIPNHINSARDALLNYIYNSKKSTFLDKKLIFLSGSPVLDKTGGILTGRLSGIANHHVPGYLRGNQKPSYPTNCIEDWEEKLEQIIKETQQADMSLISGIPPWVQMYFDKLHQKTGKKIKDIFPNFSLFVYGGVNFSPYKDRIFDSIGKQIDSIETFPASEGFFAFQDTLEHQGLLLLLNTGIFFEFVPTETYFSDNPTRLTIDQVEIGKNYALIINSNAGLWGYSIGDTVQFVSKNPYRLIVSGRIKHFISAFGEHVIGQEVEYALSKAMQKFTEVRVSEFTVAPQVTPAEGLPHHQWCIAFENAPNDLAAFSQSIDLFLQEKNSYYADLRKGNIIDELKISALPSDAFQQYMKSIGKLGGQNKVPRLSNDRKIVTELVNFSSHI